MYEISALSAFHKKENGIKINRTLLCGNTKNRISLLNKLLRTPIADIRLQKPIAVKRINILLSIKIYIQKHTISNLSINIYTSHASIEKLQKNETISYRVFETLYAYQYRIYISTRQSKHHSSK